MDPFRRRAARRGRASRGAARARGWWAAGTGAVVALAVLPAVTAGIPAAHADEVTVSQNDLRTSWDQSEPTLTPAAVSGGNFGQLFSTPVNGSVYGQPLVVGSTVIVTTENDWVYGLDAASGAVDWSVSLGTPWAIGSVCGDLVPNIGITGTPVYDPDTGAVYLMALTSAGSALTYSLFGINVRTGAITEQVPITGSPTNDPSIAFNAAKQLERPGLLLMNGSVYAAFGSHCDGSPYVGFVAGVNVASHTTTLWSDETGVTDNQAGIWQSGGGMMSDGPGRMFFVSGNGVSPAPGPGTSPPGQLAESVVRLAVQPGGSLAAQDFFSPKNAPTLDAQDLDFGSGGSVALPFGSSKYPDLMVATGKYGRIYLLNRDNLGGREQGPNGGDASLRVICCFNGLWGSPAAFADTPTLTTANMATANDFIYMAANTDYLREMKWGIDSTGVPYLHTVATSTFTFAYTSGSPVVTSDGTDPSSAIAWEVGVTHSTGAGGTLYAFNAVPASTCTSGSPCKLTPIWSAPIGTASKFSMPATNGGRVYVGTRDGHVLGFGLTSGAPLGRAAPAGFGQVPVGSHPAKDVSLTAAKRVTVTGVSAGSGAPADLFSVGRVTETVHRTGAQVLVSFPVTLSRGDVLRAPVTFSPAVPGGAAGSLSFATRSARFRSVNVPLSGDGVRPGLSAIPGSLSFKLVTDVSVTNVPVGMSEPAVVTITNVGTTRDTVTSVTAPAGRFTASGLPAPGTVIKPGQSFNAVVTFTPKRAVTYTSSFEITGTSGKRLIVQLSGTGLAPVSRFTRSRPALHFGAVPVGKKVTAVVDIANSGNQPAIMTRVAPLAGSFAAPYRVAKGLPVNPGEDLSITVTFRPVRKGRFTDAYRLTWHDPLGSHTVDVALTGSGTG
jgi:hypothetical protein